MEILNKKVKEATKKKFEEEMKGTIPEETFLDNVLKAAQAEEKK